MRKINDDTTLFMEEYIEWIRREGRPVEVIKKIMLHLKRFKDYYTEIYNNKKLSVCIKRDINGFQKKLLETGLSGSTVNNHIASISGFMSFIHTRYPDLFQKGLPTKGIGELPLPPLEPRTLNDVQLRSLKSICDRLEKFYEKKGRNNKQAGEIHKRCRPIRNRAMIFTFLSTGLRREELIRLEINQLVPNKPDELRKVRRAKIINVKGKGKTERTVFLSKDARIALADYLEYERPVDESDKSEHLFLSAYNLPARKENGKLTVRAINLILEQIGNWHDAEVKDKERKISPLRPHDLRHTFAFQLAKTTGADSYELERRLGHRSSRYIQRYTKPPEEVAAGYVEGF